MAKKRSPSYPRIGLNRAISLASRIFEGAGKGEIDSETAVRLMGFQAVSGPSTSALSSLKQFGLLEGRGDHLRLTDLAMQLLEPMDDSENRAAMREASVMPELYAELLTKFNGKAPADEVIRSYLVRNAGFNSNSANVFIKSFRETLAYVDSLAPLRGKNRDFETMTDDLGETPQHSDDSGGPVPLTHSVAQPVRPQASIEEISAESEVLTFRISSDALVRVVFDGEITQRAIDKLIQFLELSKDSYPREKVKDFSNESDEPSP